MGVLKSFVLAMQRLLASARALVSDGSSASIADLHEAEEDHATISNVFASKGRGECVSLIGGTRAQ